jgi:hypothetical protein
MPVGQWFVVENPPRSFGQRARSYGNENGKVFRISKEPGEGCWYKVRRIV